MKPGRDDVARRVELAVAVEALADPDDAPAVDRHVGPAARRPGAVDDRAPADHQLGCHGPTLRARRRPRLGAPCGELEQTGTAGATMLGMSMPRPEFEGVIGRTYDDSEGWWPPLPVGAGGRPQRRDRAARRRGLRAARLLRLRHRHAVLRPARRRGPPLLELPHHRAVLADAGLPAHRPQPPQQRHGAHRRARGRLPRLQRDDPARERLPVRDPPAQRLRHLRGRQVAPHAGVGDDDGQPAGQVAARSGLRALLRLHGRRDRPVPPGARVRQPLRRAAAHAGGGLPPHRGPRRPGDPLHEGPARHRARQAVLPLVHARRVPRAAPGADGVHRPVPRPVRPGVGRVARAGVRSARSRPGCCPRARGCPSARRGCRRGTRSPTTSATSTAG